ncbi:MAG: hypothetical protein ABSE80_11570 [Halobacteriota archaeon]|jgi:hypothetical protein
MRPKPTTPEKVFYAASKALSQPLTYEVSYAWSVDGNGVGGAATAEIWTNNLSPGTHSIEVVSSVGLTLTGSFTVI